MKRPVEPHRNDGRITEAVAHSAAKISAFDRLADLATLLVAAAWLARLAIMAKGARFATDECFHATVVEWIARHGRLPDVLPEFYSGFAAGYYPPLFHLLGAAWTLAFGMDALKYLNVFLTGLLLATLWVGGRALGRPAAGRWAVALVAAGSWFSTYALRLYVEQLTTLLGVLVLILLVRLHSGGGRRVMIALGVATGLMLTAKNSAIAVEGLVVAVALVDLLRGNRVAARRSALAAGIALLVAAPMFVRTAVLYGSPLYPAFAPDLDHRLFELNRARFTPPPLELYGTTASAIGLAIGALVLGSLVLLVVRRRFSFAAGLLLVCLATCLAGPLQALLDTRHLLPAIAGMALLSGLVVEEQVDSARLRNAITIACLLVAIACVATMPDRRRPLNVPAEELDAFSAVAREVPEGERVLSLLTYDTYYYSRRPATWPVAWGQKDRPSEMFLTTDCDTMVESLARHRVRYVLLWRPSVAATFDGANYPAAFVNCMVGRVGEGRAQLLWRSDFAALIRVPRAPIAR